MSVGAVRDVKGFTIDQAKVRTWKRYPACNRSGHPFTTPCSYPSYHNPPFLRIRPYNR
jgi:hypothetical protein